MKKIKLTLFTALVIAQAGLAQNTFPANGNAGIGITTPNLSFTD